MNRPREDGLGPLAQRTAIHSHDRSDFAETTPDDMHAESDCCDSQEHISAGDVSDIEQRH